VCFAELSNQCSNVCEFDEILELVECMEQFLIIKLTDDQFWVHVNCLSYHIAFSLTIVCTCGMTQFGVGIIFILLAQVILDGYFVYYSASLLEVFELSSSIWDINK